MKNLFLTLLLVISLPCLGAEHSKSPKSPTSIAGFWADSNCTGNFSDCALVISQTGDSLHMIHSLKFQGKLFVEEGRGKIDSTEKVLWTVQVTHPIPGWATAGKHELQLSKNGQKLAGKYEDNKGNTGPLVFRRKTSEP